MAQTNNKTFHFSVPGFSIRVTEKPHPILPEGSVLAFEINVNIAKLFLTLVALGVLLAFVFGDLSLSSILAIGSSGHVQP